MTVPEAEAPPAPPSAAAPAAEHHAAAAAREEPLRLAVVTVSDSREPESDANRAYLEAAIAAEGHRLLAYRLIRDEPAAVGAVLDELVAAGAEVLVFNGGTGIAPRDTTYDALAGRIEKPMPGFGELFRMLSWQEVGAAAMLSRATAGIYRGSAVFSLPGSPKAVRLAWERLIAPELAHIAWLLEER